MVTIEISRIDARRLCPLLAGAKRGYREGIVHLEKIKEVDPERKFGRSQQTAEETIETNQKMIDTIDRVLEQIRE